MENTSITISQRIDFMFSEVNPDSYEIGIYRNGIEIGEAVLTLDTPSTGYIDEIWITQSWRGLGIATALYDYIENAGLELRPTLELDEVGQRFWGDRLQHKQAMRP